MDFLNVLENVLKKDDRFVAEDGKLLKPVIYSSAMNMDEFLIALLIENQQTKEHFFTDVNGILVFDKVKFGWVVDSKEFLPDSYTSYKNKIGLVDNNGHLLSAKEDVTLVWPYKDCILEGGQTKDDQKRDEIFYNETLAPDEVKRLLHPKVLTGAKRYTRDGAEDITTFDDKDNLIIKGNNLLALSSLLNQKEGKVKLINIDPPYNTGADSFKYNDAFNHSTWLTFMKNRLELAKKLLRSDGFLCCQVNESESYYLKVLLDEIFGVDNYLSTLFIKVRYAEKTLKQDMDFHKEIEQILVYRKSSKAVPCFNQVESSFDKYIYKVIESGEFSTIRLGTKRVDIYKEGNYEIVESKPTSSGLKEIWASGTILDGNSSGRFFRDFLTHREFDDGLCTLYKVYGMGDDQFDYRYFTGPKRKNATKGKYYQGVPTAQLEGAISKDVPINNFYDMSADFGNCRHEGGVEFRSGKKPEVLYSLLLKHFSESGNLVIDYFLGSGTTCAVAHKMGRKYIGIEQMDYGENDGVTRINNVIQGDSTGISKDIGWQGGGSFVYCELKELNEVYVKQIQSSSSKEDLENIKAEIIGTGFISHKVDIKEIAGKNAAFDDLSLEEQKQFLMELIDKNKLYVNYSEIDDKDMKVSDAEKAFSHSFYKKED